MRRLYCPECGNYLEGGDGEMHDCSCGWKQPIEESYNDSDELDEESFVDTDEIESLRQQVAELREGYSVMNKDWLKIQDEKIEQAELIEKLATELKHNAEVFRRYQQLHLLKHTEDGNDKAHANGSYADRCENALKLVEQWKEKK